jgi:hypothetical protein
VAGATVVKVLSPLASQSSIPLSKWSDARDRAVRVGIPEMATFGKSSELRLTISDKVIRNYLKRANQASKGCVGKPRWRIPVLGSTPGASKAPFRASKCGQRNETLFRRRDVRQQSRLFVLLQCTVNRNRAGSRLLFLAECLESGVAAQRVPYWIEP